MSDGEFVIDARDVVKTFDDGRTRALDGATLQVRRGEFVAITGPSGCGKSTLLHQVAALERPDSGAIVVNGVDITKQRDLSRYRAHTIGLVFQLHNLLPNLTALENVQVPMYETALSGGERQRVAVARALSNDPPIVLADEPTGNLDSKAGQRVLEVLRRIQQERGVTLVLVTHDPTIAAAADRIVNMLDGRISDEGGKAQAGGQAVQ